MTSSLITSPSLKAAMYGFNEFYDPFIHGKQVVESRIKSVIGDVDIYDPHYVQYHLGLAIPLCERYGNYSPQFEMMILNEAGFIANFWANTVEKLGDAKDAAVDYLEQKYEQGKEAAKEKIDDFKDATVGFAKKAGAFAQTMWTVTTGGGADAWIGALKWQSKKIYKWWKSKFEKLVNYVDSVSWLSALKKPIEWIWDKITWMYNKLREASGAKGALLATGAAVGIAILKKKFEDKLEDVLTYVDKALGGAGLDPDRQTAQDGLIATAAKEVSEEVKKEVIAKLKGTFVEEIYNWVKDKIKSMASTAVGSAITGGWAAYKDTLIAAYESTEAVVSAIGPALKRAGGLKMGDKLFGGLHKVQLERLQLAIQNVLVEISVSNIVSLEHPQAKTKKIF
jgi:hypothetical protein